MVTCQGYINKHQSPFYTYLLFRPQSRTHSCSPNNAVVHQCCKLFSSGCPCITIELVEICHISPASASLPIVRSSLACKYQIFNLRTKIQENSSLSHFFWLSLLKSNDIRFLKISLGVTIWSMVKNYPHATGQLLVYHIFEKKNSSEAVWRL